MKDEAAETKKEEDVAQGPKPAQDENMEAEEMKNK